MPSSAAAATPVLYGAILNPTPIVPSVRTRSLALMAKRFPLKALSMRNPLAAFGFALLLNIPSSALAQVENVTRGEMALLPEVCMDVQAMALTGWVQHWRESPRSPYWVSRLGKAFWGMHHYCWALLHLQRAKQVGLSPQVRAHMIRTAIADYYYVIQNADNKFVLLPELYYRIGMAHVQLQDPVKAMDAFEKAKAAKIDYWPAYVGLADVQAGIGRRAEAITILDEGLKLLPEDPNLLAARKRIAAPRSGAAVKGSAPAH